MGLEKIDQVPERDHPLWWAMNQLGYDAADVHRQLGVLAPPIDLVAMAHAMGIQVTLVHEYSRWDGVAKSVAGVQAQVLINANQSRNRQRFTLAHEIGHIVLHKPGVRYRDRWAEQPDSSAEIEANQFAAQLLMPADMIHALTQDKTSVRALAKLFRVSSDAMSYRLTNLGYQLG